MQHDRLLLVDDDAELSVLVSDYLLGENYIVETATTAEAAWHSIAASPIDLVLLDVRLPDADGFSMLRDLRTKGSLPVIMLTSRRTPVDRILGLELGADDYIAKPFELAELRARIRAVLRRARQVEDSDVAGSIEALTFAGLILDLTHRRLLGADGKELLLTSGEFDLLRVFAEHPRRPLTQNQLMDLARARNWTPCDRSMDMLVSRLRRRIASVVHGAEIIATARNVGYVFDVKVDRRLLVASAVRASLG